MSTFRDPEIIEKFSFKKTAKNCKGKKGVAHVPVITLNPHMIHANQLETCPEYAARIKAIWQARAEQMPPSLRKDRELARLAKFADPMYLFGCRYHITCANCEKQLDHFANLHKLNLCPDVPGHRELETA